MLEYLFIAFLAIVSIQIFYYLFIFGRFAFLQEPLKKNTSQKPISVLICAKNEALNLKENIPHFINQQYAKFELILINDGSQDESLAVMKKFKKKFPNQITIVDVVSNEHFWGSKKYALSLGIKAANYDHLLFSDADCKPKSTQWISEMANCFQNEHEIVLGYGAYQKIENSFLNKLIRFETLMTAIQYFSYAKIGIPYMGVGRNLAYKKDLFFTNKGFSKHIKIKSGDDDLFINQVASSKNTEICFSKDSFTESKPKTTFKKWIHQKRRHISTAKHYKKVHQYLLGLFFSSQLLLWILFLILILNVFQWKIVLAGILLRILLQYVIIGFAAKKLNEFDLIKAIPILEIFLISIQLFIFIKNTFSKPTYW